MIARASIVTTSIVKTSITKLSAVLAIVLSIALPLLLASCNAQARGSDVDTAAIAPRQIIVALDLSGSQSDGRLGEARRTLDMVIESVNWGDRLVLMEVHQGSAAEDGVARWTETAPLPATGRAPTSLDRERLESVRQAARSVGEAMFARDSAGRLPSTDLVATLHVVAEYIRDGGTRPAMVVLLSDMYQSAHGIEMSRPDGMPPHNWVDRQQSAGVLPHLDGVCIAVVGADASSAHGVAVREFWTRYFAAAGAQLSYRLMTTSADGLGCTNTGMAR